MEMRRKYFRGIMVGLGVLLLAIISFWVGTCFEKNKFITVQTPDGILYIDKKRPSLGICIADSIFLLEKLDAKEIKSLHWHLNDFLDSGVIFARNRMRALDNKDSRAYKTLYDLLCHAAKYRRHHPRNIDNLVTGLITNEREIAKQHEVDAILHDIEKNKH